MRNRNGNKGRDWEVVQDERGRILGKYYSSVAPMQEQLQIIRDFLRGLNKGGTMTMKETNKNDRCNIAYIAGVIQSLKVRDDGGAWLLVDTGSDSQYIPCTVHKSETLTSVLGKFDVGDEIKLVGFVRAWGKKLDGGGYDNRVEVRVTEVKTQPPQRQPKAQPKTQRQFANDDVPF